MLLAAAVLVVLVRTGVPVPGDAALARRPAGGAPRAVALVVDGLTGYAATAVLLGLAVLLLLRWGRRREAALWALSVTGTVLLTTVLKQLVDRPRPELLPPTTAVSSLSFPSGHAAATAAAAVALVLAVRSRRARVRAAVVGALFATGAAVAQLVLSRHHASDVLAGWLVAGGTTTAVWAAAGSRRR
jgi:membrane-associated phospholipid phosphatase